MAAIALGPLSERSLPQPLIASHGSWVVSVTRPLSLTFLVLSLVLFLLPIVTSRLNTLRKSRRLSRCVRRCPPGWLRPQNGLVFLYLVY